jgi:hypothetical protein
MNKLNKKILSLILALIISGGAVFMVSGAAAITDHGLTMHDFIGTNGFFTDIDVLSNYTPFGFIREYHNWDWTEYTANPAEGNTDAATKTDGSIAVFHSNLWGGVFDRYYEAVNKMGIDLVICVQLGVPESGRVNPNWQDDGDPLNPRAYLAHAQSMFQHAARYGGNKDLDPDLVRVEPGGNKQIGMGLIKYYENWNEPDATWEPMGNGQFSGAMYAAMLSADYDGHMNTMGPDAGVKNADPGAKVVIGGLAVTPVFHSDERNHMKFTEEMLEWFDEHRSEEKWLRANGSLDGYVKYPFDVMNGHFYATNNRTGLSPEDYGLYERSRRYAEWCRENFPGAEIWMSEFGWETGPIRNRFSATVEYTDERGILRHEGINAGVDIYDVQGRWIVRGYLIQAAAGIDRAMQFMLNNSGTTDAEHTGGWFETCGFIDGGVSSGSVKRKPSWYYVSAMHHWIKNTRFKSVISHGGDQFTPAVYEFEEDGRSAYALWLTTSLGISAKVDDFRLDVGDAEYAVAVELADKEKHGIGRRLEIIDGYVSVSVTEKPVFVITSDVKIEDGSIADVGDAALSVPPQTPAGDADAPEEKPPSADGTLFAKEDEENTNANQNRGAIIIAAAIIAAAGIITGVLVYLRKKRSKVIFKDKIFSSRHNNRGD